MNKSRLWSAACAYLAIFSCNVSASIVDFGTYVRDTATGLEWLDLSATASLSYDSVSAETGIGGAFEGWSYATRSEVLTLWTAFGGDANFYSGWSVQNDGLFDALAPLMGDLACATRGCEPGRGFSHWITADIATAADVILNPSGNVVVGQRLSALTYDFSIRNESRTMDYLNLQQITTANDFASAEFGSALFRSSAVSGGGVVPVPAAVWLFGSGLIGLVGIARRKQV